MKRSNAASSPRHRDDHVDLQQRPMTVDQIVARIRWLDEMLTALQRNPTENGVLH